MTNWLPNLGNRDGPRYLVLAEAITEAIESGDLPPATRLPTHRQLAHRLGLSVHTVSSAYAEVERRGYVVGEVGRGTFVSLRTGLDEARFILDRRPTDLVDMSILRPATGRIHAERIRAVLSEMAESEDYSTLLACRPIAGLDRHRLAGATWLNRHGHAVAADRVLIVNGCAHGLTVALATLTKPGDTVATEALTDHGTIALASILHVKLRGLETDDEGIIPDAFAAACHGGDVRVLVCTPNYANPTGTLMPEARRRRLAEIARHHGVVVVEDDVFLALSSEPIPPIAALVPEHSVYITSMTKTIVSGLRTGYLVAPDALMHRMIARLRATSWMATPIAAEIATRWIADGTADELVAWQRAELDTRLALLNRRLGGYEYIAYPHAPHVFLSLPSSWRAENFATQAKLRHVAVAPAEPFVVGRLPEPQAIRITLGAATSRTQLDSGLAALAQLLVEEPEPAYLQL
jgi:DNA-binding transcriptional MocR family regulator